MNLSPRITVLWAACLGLAAAPAVAQPRIQPFIDHVHLLVPDQAGAIAWYRKYFGAEPYTVLRATGETATAADRVTFGPVQLAAQRATAGAPGSSAGTNLDSIGYSVTDLRATLQRLQGDGVKITEPISSVPGLYPHAFIEDPWGVRIELVEDPQSLGLHHVRMWFSNPPSALRWLASHFGGQVAKFKGRVDGIRYGDVWLFVEQGTRPSSTGHAIDHIGFRVVDTVSSYLGEVSATAKVTTPARDASVAGATINIAFIDGPDGMRFEIVKRCPELAGGCEPTR